jgi:hypothetical protein
MSWSIPALIEADIKSGKAQYRTFQTGNGGQSILPVPSNSYVVIFGYDFSPAGGGFKRISTAAAGGATTLNQDSVRWFETQQIAFYTGTDFYPFIHHVDVKSTAMPFSWDATAPDNNFIKLAQFTEEIDSTPIARQLYITSTNDVTITHGLILNAAVATAGVIPVTNRTPLGLTYGGTVQTPSVQTNYGPAGTPLQFMQPSPKDFADFGLGLLPSNADGQAYATPDRNNGLRDASDFLNLVLGTAFLNSAAANYYLCLHYALYTETVPDSRG